MKYILSIACILILSAGTAHAQSSAEAGQTQGQSQSVTGSQAAATAGANQGQSQGQTAIGGGGSVSHSGNASLGINNSFNGAAPIRYLPVPAAIPIENYQGAYFGGADYSDKGPNFISMRQLIGIMNMVDLNADIEGERHIHITKQMMVTLPEDHAAVSEETQEMIVVKFDINDGAKVNGGFSPIAVLSIEAEKPDKSNSASLAMAVGKEARKLGAKRVIFLTEGSSKEMRSSGWGIGFSYNYAQVNSDPSGNGSVGSGGFGYSQGKAGYKNLIYLTAIVGN